HPSTPEDSDRRAPAKCIGPFTTRGEQRQWHRPRQLTRAAETDASRKAAGVAELATPTRAGAGVVATTTALQLRTRAGVVAGTWCTTTRARAGVVATRAGAGGSLRTRAADIVESRTPACSTSM